jgi:hypothetical protein
MNFAQAISQRGINEKNAIANLRRRATYHRNLDRPKVWACSPCPASRFDNRGLPVKGDRNLEAFDILKVTTDTAEYVDVWCFLNHLKP